MTLNTQFHAAQFASLQGDILIKHKNHMQWRKATFGLIPSWSSDAKIARHTYNARLETVQYKPSFRQAWQRKQFALVAVQRFYEPRYISPKAERWAIERKDGQAFTLAAIYDMAQLDLQPIRSVSMLTINADDHPLMRQFHAPDEEKRSVVVIPAHLRKAWLNADQHSARAMLTGLPVEEFTSVAAPQ